MGMIERSIEVERPAEDVWACGPDRSRFTVRINFTMPFGLLGRVASALGVQRRARARPKRS